MIIKVNDTIYLQTRNILDVIDEPNEDSVAVYFNTSTQMFQAKHVFKGQDRRDVLKAMERAGFHVDS